MIKWMLAALLAAMVGAAAMANLPAAKTVYVMRHLNTPEGERDPDLTDAGYASAEALARWFRGKKLTAIYSSEFRRTLRTVGPLASSRGIVVKIYDPRDTPALVAMLKAEPGPVLVVGHSNTVPDIVEQLGGTRPGPLAHPDFGDIWTIKGGRTGHDKLP